MKNTLYQTNGIVEKSFSTMFKLYRLKAGFATLSEFGKALSSEGYVYEDSIFSRWQRGNRIPHNRNLILTIAKIFVKSGSITSLQEANQFFESARQGYITDFELNSLSSFTRSDSIKTTSSNK